MMSFTRVDLPLPEAPVTTVKVDRGMLTSICFKLCSVAPRTVSRLPLPGRRAAGRAIFLRPAS